MTPTEKPSIGSVVTLGLSIGLGFATARSVGEVYGLPLALLAAGAVAAGTGLLVEAVRRTFRRLRTPNVSE